VYKGLMNDPLASCYVCTLLGTIRYLFGSHRFGVYVELRERREMDTNTGFDNSNFRIETGTPAVNYHQVIRHLNPAVIPL
jgi:hypothetical protein